MTNEEERPTSRPDARPHREGEGRELDASCPAAMITARARRSPTGTVTFLFTDVEGSTRLLRELGAEAYADALAEHRRVIREAAPPRAASRSTPRGTRSFSRSRPHRERSRRRPLSRRRSRRVRSGPGRPAYRDAASGRGGIRRRGRPPRRPHRSLRPRRTGPRLCRGGAAPVHRPARPRRASLQGSRRAGARLPARGAGVPASEEPVPDEPPGPGERLHRSTHRARRGREPPRIGGHPPPDPHRPRRNREDAARRPCCGRGRRGVPGRHRVGAARIDPRHRIDPARDR